jgi:hypothetical protein
MMVRLERLSTGSIGMIRRGNPSRRRPGASPRRCVPGVDLMGPTLHRVAPSKLRLCRLVSRHRINI